MTLTETYSLSDLAAAANREHLACEQAYGSALEHAFRAGEYLLTAKAELEHGEWGRWVGENFDGSERTARGYMRLARVSNRQDLADLGIERALGELATPREADEAEESAGEGEVVEAEPVEEEEEISADDAFAKLRESLGPLEAERLQAQEKAEQARFPRPGVERATVRQIRAAAAAASQGFTDATHPGYSDWSRAEALERAAGQYQEAAELCSDLAAYLRG